MATFVVAAQKFDLDRQGVENAVARVLPEPVREHYVVVAGRRFPPKQVLGCVTGLDRADFTTHQARRVLKRLGFVAARVASAAETVDPGGEQGEQARALAAYEGQWVALDSPTEVLVAADTPEEVLAWLSTHERRARYGMFRVPGDMREVQGMAPA